MNSQAQPKFSWSDAWLLDTIAAAAADHPATLREIIGMGDAIEKSVFSFEELSSGLAKLESAGYIRAVGAGFELQPAVSDQFRSACGSHGRDARSWFQRFLKAPSWSPEAERESLDQSWRYPGLTREAVSAAFDEYKAEIAAIVEKVDLPGA